MHFDNLRFNPDTRLFPIIGYPMGQSSASHAYNPLFVANNLNEIMWPVEIRPEQLADFMAAARTLGIRHFTLTMPLKSAIIPHLDVVDEDSRFFNSVNIVRFDGEGRSHGAGMDGKGNLAAIQAAGVDVRGMRVVMLGSGAIVGAITLQLAGAGAASVTILNRSVDKAAALVERLRPRVGAMQLDAGPFTGESINQAAERCDFLMQSTPLGMYGYDRDFDDLSFIDRLPAHAVVMENIVNPPVTQVVKAASARGLKTIAGIDMLLGQLGAIFNFCYGFTPPPEQLLLAKAGIYGYFGI